MIRVAARIVVMARTMIEGWGHVNLRRNTTKRRVRRAATLSVSDAFARRPGKAPA